MAIEIPHGRARWSFRARPRGDRIMRHAGLAWVALVLGLGIATPARSQTVTVTGAEITWYGVYQAEQARVVQEPGALSGTRKVSTNITPPSVNSVRVAIADNTRFGFGFRLNGDPSGAAVKLKIVQRMPPPGALNAVTGKRSRLGEFEANAKIGASNLFTGWLIGKAASAPAGNWTFEIWHDGRKLTGKTFTLYHP
jgi:hypothetical protein